MPCLRKHLPCHWLLSAVFLSQSVPAVEPAELVLSSPQRHAVFQRDDTGMAQLEVSGTYSGAVTRIEGRAIPRSGFSGTPTDWQVIEDSPAAGTFSGVLEISHGWYNVEVHSSEGSSVVGRDLVEQVGVGEIFVTAGQSNAANHGDNEGVPNPQTPADERVSAFDGTTWQFAEDPQPIATGTGGSPWPDLGDLLTATYQVPVGFYSVGVNQSGVDRWLPSREPPDLYPLLGDAMNFFGPNGFRSVLWHQGETDAISNTTAQVYFDRLRSVIAQSRVDAGFVVPWGVALASYIPRIGNDPDIINGQLMVIAVDPFAFQGAATDDMIVPYRGLTDFMGCHFNDAGLEEHARRWADALRSIIPDIDPPPPAGGLGSGIGLR